MRRDPRASARRRDGLLVPDGAGLQAGDPEAEPTVALRGPTEGVLCYAATGGYHREGGYRAARLPTLEEIERGERE